MLESFTTHSVQDASSFKMSDILKPIPVCLRRIEIIESPFMVERKQVRFPRSKKSRMQKKWRKNPKNWQNFAAPDLIKMDGDKFGQPGVDIICGHPSAIRALREQVVARADRQMSKLISDAFCFPGNHGIMNGYTAHV